MTILPAGVVADVANLVNATLTGSAVNSRTNVTTPCAIQPVLAHQRLVHLGNQQEYVRLRQWGVTFPLGTDLKVGDILTISGTAYCILNVAEEGTYVAMDSCYVCLANAAPDILTTDTVQFQKRDSTETTASVSVAIVPVDRLEQVTQTGYSYTHVVVYDDTITFADGTPIGEGDYIIWSDLSNGRAALAFPQRERSVHVAFAYFKDV